MLDKQQAARLLPISGIDGEGGGDERARAAALPLEPARLGQAHHQLRRRQHLGQGDGEGPARPASTVEVLWVKGSGGDVGTIKLDGFATLYMDKLEALKGLYRGVDHEDEMVGYLPHCTFNLNPRAASIDTPLHAYVPHKHVDHMHPDAIIAIAASKDRSELTQEIFGDEIGWLPWKRPGYELGLWLEKFCAREPGRRGVVLESHGLFTWGDTRKELLRDHDRHHQPARSTGSRARPRRRPSAARLEPLRAGRAAARSRRR